MNDIRIVIGHLKVFQKIEEQVIFTKDFSSPACEFFPQQYQVVVDGLMPNHLPAEFPFGHVLTKGME